MTIREAPRIETERLVLRQWRKDDFRHYHAIISHPEVHRHFGPEPMSAEDCWRRITSAAGNWQLNGFGGWAVERKADGKLIGNVALFTAWRDLEPEFGEEPEMGWMFAAETHGQGMASEASLAALTWAEANLAPTPIWAIIAPENEPSIKLAQKIGFERAGETTYKDDPTLVFKRRAWG
jgi:RimJ/RimL family protein N-acetyltransferase